ncbi:hypothetical protein MILUP08_42271 [Micromonospora lupini str. Lupac 08]|uniref:Uncharacterized protein n=1 Tax=Micromonospora lupini str. Lupac 08 TaxID=1150864 RepID=I0L0K3_9ACTN|nr:hypothetical protein MILUP08_42271 [Micromonospora lupini str. Lupac 08]
MAAPARGCRLPVVGPCRAGPVRAGPVRAGPVRAGPVRAGSCRGWALPVAGPTRVRPPARGRLLPPGSKGWCSRAWLDPYPLAGPCPCWPLPLAGPCRGCSTRACFRWCRWWAGAVWPLPLDRIVFLEVAVSGAWGQADFLEPEWIKRLRPPVRSSFERLAPYDRFSVRLLATRPHDRLRVADMAVSHRQDDATSAI